MSHSTETPVGQGWVARLDDESTIRAAIDKAFDYRGDVTITLADGSTVEGYLFDRNGDGATLADCRVRLWPKSGEKIAVPYDRIAGLAFSGRDTAAGKSFETWIANHRARKAAGQSNISLAPEPLEE